ncbi:MAG TPA: MBL fold metallo-hydrolase [Ktedonosporobacter sp.]|nr:MBL fold metallo-hydrolase [Ktedonosporobacter sp.]
MEQQSTREISERPENYLGPDLNPEGLILKPQELAPGVYALMANIMPKDNNGVIIGEHGVLVIDAGVNGTISQQIQQHIRELTDKPLRYLVNTTYHGDHTFGNAAFPEQVTIISSRQNKQSMHDLAYEKQMRSGNLRGNVAAVADVTTWRRPDVTFERFCEVDLGNKIVQLWHFGPGNAPGDTIVYVPDAKIAWTGNFLMRAGICHMLLEGGPVPYIKTLQAMKATLDVKTIVPGHGPMGEGPAALDALIGYLEELDQRVRADIDAGMSLEAILASYPCPQNLVLPTQLPFAAALNPLNQQLHRLNILAVYREVKGKSSTAAR